MKIQVNRFLDSDRGTSRKSGELFFNHIKDVHPSSLILSFEGMSKVSTLFLNESIGKYVLKYNGELSDWTPLLNGCSSIITYKVQDVIENAMMGEDYDEILADAQLA